MGAEMPPLHPTGPIVPLSRVPDPSSVPESAKGHASEFDGRNVTVSTVPSVRPDAMPAALSPAFGKAIVQVPA